MDLPLPDPHLRNVKFETIQKMGPIPPMLSDFIPGFKNGGLKMFLDQYLLCCGSPSFPTSLRDRWEILSVLERAEDTYNVPLINALVMYIGVSTVAQAKARSGIPLFNPSDPGVVILQYLVMNLDPEGMMNIKAHLEK